LNDDQQDAFVPIPTAYRVSELVRREAAANPGRDAHADFAASAALAAAD
jgi:hypothetical protein